MSIIHSLSCSNVLDGFSCWYCSDSHNSTESNTSRICLLRSQLESGVCSRNNFSQLRYFRLSAHYSLCRGWLFLLFCLISFVVFLFAFIFSVLASAAGLMSCSNGSCFPWSVAGGATAGTAACGIITSACEITDSVVGNAAIAHPVSKAKLTLQVLGQFFVGSKPNWISSVSDCGW